MSRDPHERRARIAAGVGLACGAALLLLGADESGSPDRHVPAGLQTALLVAIAPACLAYGYARGRRRAMWTATWVSLLLIAALDGLARAACMGAICDSDPDDPVMSPAIGVVALPLVVGLVAAGVGLRRRAWHVT